MNDYDPFVKNVPLGVRIIDPVQMHTNGDINCCFRGRLGNVSVVLRESHRYTVREVKDEVIKHPNLLINFGTTPLKDFEILEGYFCNLAEFLEKIKHSQSKENFAVDFSSQILDGLQRLRIRELAHRNLTPENIVIQIDPPIDLKNANLTVESDSLLVDRLRDPDTCLTVKLKDYETSKAGEAYYLKDLKFFGRILNLLLDQDNLSEEASDLLCRIQGRWEDINMDSDDHQHLLNLFKEAYVLSPAQMKLHPYFWLSLTNLEFLSTVDEFLTLYYEQPKPPESVKAFVAALVTLEVDKNWTRDLHDSIKDTALRRHKGKKDEGTSVGVLKCIRNVHTHYVVYVKNAKDEIGRKDCYAYFQMKYPKLLMHTLRCLEIHYPKMRKSGDIDPSCDDTFMPYISSVVVSLREMLLRENE